MEDKELQPVHVRGGHEEKDVNFIAITKFGIGLTITMLATVFVMWGLFHYFVSSEEKEYGVPSQLPAAAGSAAKVPPQPRLQQSPPIDLREMRAAEDQLLHHYSWADKDKGAVRMPIDRAMDLLAERGLKSRPAAEALVGQSVSPAPNTANALSQDGQAKPPAPPKPESKK